jgi:hypothetical protein
LHRGMVYTLGQRSFGGPISPVWYTSPGGGSIYSSLFQNPLKSP